MRTRVLVSGAGGAIGIHMLAHICHHTDWDIIATDSFRHKGYFDRITLLLKDHPEWRERITTLVHDLNAPFTEREITGMGEVQYIINLASISDVQASIDDPVPTVRNNVELMLNMLELSRNLDARAPMVIDEDDYEQYPPKMVKAFLHFSTDEVYGATGINGAHKEWAEILPSNPYSASKAAQEALAIAWWRSFDVPVIITNTMNNFGETQSRSKFPAMIQDRIQHLRPIDVHVGDDGEAGTRYYIHSRNVADAVLFILNNIPAYRHQSGEVDKPLRYNIVGDKQVSNLELVETIARLMGEEPVIRTKNFHKDNPGHDVHYGLDGSKLAEAGWKSPVPFEESLKNTIDWQRDNPTWL